MEHKIGIRVWGKMYMGGEVSTSPPISTLTQYRGWGGCFWGWGGWMGLLLVCDCGTEKAVSILGLYCKAFTSA